MQGPEMERSQEKKKRDLPSRWTSPQTIQSGDRARQRSAETGTSCSLFPLSAARLANRHRRLEVTWSPSEADRFLLTSSRAE
jgi:hypothetical protein